MKRTSLPRRIFAAVHRARNEALGEFAGVGDLISLPCLTAVPNPENDNFIGLA